MRLETDWTAWQLDEAAALVGLQVEAAAMRGETSAGFDTAAKSAAYSTSRRYASAKNRVMKKMKIPKSGIW